MAVLAAAGSRAIGDAHVRSVLDAVLSDRAPGLELLPRRTQDYDKDGLASKPGPGLEVLCTLLENPYAPPAIAEQVGDAVRATLPKLRYELRTEVAGKLAVRENNPTQVTDAPAEAQELEMLYEYVARGPRAHASTLRELAENPRLTGQQLSLLYDVARRTASAAVVLRLWLSPVLHRLAGRLDKTEQVPRDFEPVPPGLVARLLPEHFEPARRVELVLPGGSMAWLTAFDPAALCKELADLATERFRANVRAWETFFSLAEHLEAQVGDLVDTVLALHPES